MPRLQLNIRMDNKEELMNKINTNESKIRKLEKELQELKKSSS